MTPSSASTAPTAPTCSTATPSTRPSSDVRPDVVYHLGGWSDVGSSWDHPREAFQVNATGTLNLLQACSANGSPRVLAVSSADVYGRVQPDELPIRERRTVPPGDPVRRQQDRGRPARPAGLARLRPRGPPRPGVQPPRAGTDHRVRGPRPRPADRQQRARRIRGRARREPHPATRHHRRPRRRAGLPPPDGARRGRARPTTSAPAATSRSASWPSTWSPWPPIRCASSPTPPSSGGSRPRSSAATPPSCTRPRAGTPEIPLDTTLADVLAEHRAAVAAAPA